MPFHMGPFEIGIILVIILIIFGVGRLPEVGGAIGRGIHEFRKGQTGVDEATKSAKAESKGEKDETKPAEAESKDETTA